MRLKLLKKEKNSFNHRQKAQKYLTKICGYMTPKLTNNALVDSSNISIYIFEGYEY